MTNLGARWVTAAAAILLSGCSLDAAEDAWVAESHSTALQDVAYEASHNTYLPDNTDGTYITEHFTDGMMHIELDILDTSMYGTADDVFGPNWWVSHGHYGLFTTHCSGQRLSNCLARIQTYHDNNSTHPLITVWIDKKQGWESMSSTDRSPVSLDFLIDDYFPASVEIFEPGDLSDGSGPSLRDVVLTDGWPTHGDLTGRIMFVLTSHGDADGNTWLKQYAENRQLNAKAFIAPHGSSLSPPQSFGTTSVGYTWVAIYNFEWISSTSNGNCNNATCYNVDDAHGYNFLTRTWDLDDQAEYDAAEVAGANFLPVEYPWETGGDQFLNN